MRGRNRRRTGTDESDNTSSSESDGGQALALYNENLTELPDLEVCPETVHTLAVDENALATLEGAHELDNLRTLSAVNNALCNLDHVPRDALEVLNVNHNCLDDEAAGVLGEFTKLAALDIGSNTLTAFPESLLTLTGLKHLNIGKNRIHTLPPEISRLVELETLSAQGTFSTREGAGVAREMQYPMVLSELPPEIGALTKLRELWLNCNQLREIPPEVGELVLLEKLSLSHNLLASIPAEIGRLGRLSRLKLNYNCLRRLPPQLRDCTSLTSLTVVKGNSLQDFPGMTNEEVLGRLKGNVVRQNSAKGTKRSNSANADLDGPTWLVDDFDAERHRREQRMKCFRKPLSDSSGEKGRAGSRRRNGRYTLLDDGGTGGSEEEVSTDGKSGSEDSDVAGRRGFMCCLTPRAPT